MTQTQDARQTDTRQTDGDFAVPPGALGPGAPAYGYAQLQELVDRAASFDFFTFPQSAPARLVENGGGAIGVRAEQAVHAFDIDMGPPTAGGVAAANTVRSRLGTLALRWLFTPWAFVARPGHEPPPTTLDRGSSQRFVMQEASFTFDSGAGLRCFGTGRTFPMVLGGRPQLVAVAVGNVMEGFGPYRGVAGNFTLCGELTDHGFAGHVMLRLVDPDGAVRAAAARMTAERGTAGEAAAPLDPGVTFLTYLAQKGDQTRAANAFSVGRDGAVRGVNIPVDLKQVRARGALATGPVVGKEIGFGRETKPRVAGSGSALDPFQFEGVSEYAFYDPQGRTVGTFSANFLEGRTFALELAGAPGVPALRFGYYGVIMGGSGCLAGLQGILYGTAGSVFLPPPAEHVISNLYVARVSDPEGRLRALR